MTRTVCGLVLCVALAALVGLVEPTGPAAGQDKKKDKEKGKEGPAAAAVFEVYKDSGGKFRFRLKAGDANLAMASHGYASREDCLKVVQRIQREAAKAKVVNAEGKEKPEKK